MNWSRGKCGTGQGDSSKGAGARGWKTPTGGEFARSPVFNTTSSSLPVKQIRLHAVLWRLEMSAIVSLRVGVCSWMESGTTPSWSVRGCVGRVALHAEQSRAGDVRLRAAAIAPPDLISSCRALRGEGQWGRRPRRVRERPRSCYYHIISSSLHVVGDVGLRRAACSHLQEQTCLPVMCWNI